MSLQLLKTLNGRNTGNLRQFIDKFDGTENPRICWYPSSGVDFRALLYLHPSFSNISPPTRKEPAPPDIFLYTNYILGETNFPFIKSILHDTRTLVSVEDIEELPPLNTSLEPEIIKFPDRYILTNRVFFLTSKIISKRLGIIYFPVIYAFAENESFCAEKLIPNNSIISHIIHVRYGNGCGGGKTSGAWILNVLERFKSELFISDGKLEWQSGISETIRLYPVLSGNDNIPEFESIRKIQSKSWSNNGDVKWNLVL